MGLATGENIPLIATEIFQDAALETLAHPEHFHPQTQPRAWFLAIAANILKRHRATHARRYRFEVLVSDLPQQRARENEQDLLDRLMNYRGTPGPEQGLIARESVQELLALVSAEDARLLDLALVQSWSAEMLAPMLEVTPGTARVRVHRALTRLRKAWQNAEQHKKGER
jgi:RNA polymerase sigma factor (sigma-70 family)